MNFDSFNMNVPKNKALKEFEMASIWNSFSLFPLIFRLFIAHFNNLHIINSKVINNSYVSLIKTVDQSRTRAEFFPLNFSSKNNK